MSYVRFLAVVPVLEFFVASVCGGQTPAAFVSAPMVEGRPAQAVPGASANGDILYETGRIKRTVPLDISSGLEGNWDGLYTISDGAGSRTVYCNWDDAFLYLAVESPGLRTVRFDLDAKNDGWLKGTDNIALVVIPGASDNAKPTVTMQRFDTVQNRDQPVWAASPLAASEVKVQSGRTGRGTHIVTVAIPRTDVLGFPLANGSVFGLRVDAGETLPDLQGETTNLVVRPMLRLHLADSIDARTPKGLRVNVKLGAKEHVLGEQMKATIEVKNEGSSPVRVNKLTLRGSQSSFNLVDSANFTGEDILPGKTLRREIKTGVSPSAPFATLVFTGNVESDEGASVAALAAFEHVEPYSARLEVDKKPAGGGADAPNPEAVQAYKAQQERFNAQQKAEQKARDEQIRQAKEQKKPVPSFAPPASLPVVAPPPNTGFSRTVRLVVRSRIKARDKAKVTLNLPEKWRVISQEPGELRLDYKGDAKAVFYKVYIPVATPVGSYPVEAVVDLGGRTYRAKNFLPVMQQ